MFATKKLTTREEVLTLMNCRRLPARLSSGEVAVLLRFSEPDIALLIASKLLVVLGRPAKNGPKYFATVDILEAMQNRSWLSKATLVVSQHWYAKNQKAKV